MNNQKYITTFLLLAFSTPMSADNKVVGTIYTGVNPTGIAITPDSHYAYVANNNNYGIAGQYSVSVLNLEHNHLRTTIFDDSFNEPYTITINHAGTKAYVTNSNSTTITIIDIGHNTVIGTIDGFDGPSGMAITSNDNYAYVNNYGAGDLSGLENTVRVVDLTTNSIIGDSIVVDQAPAAIAISPDDTYVYTINYVDGTEGTGTMSVIQTSDNTVIATVSGFFGPFGIAITGNGKYAYVTNFGSNNFAPFGRTVSIVNLHDLEIVETLNVGIQPSGVAITPDGEYVYVTNYNTLYAGADFTNLTAGRGTVTIINRKKKQVVSEAIPVDQSPANIAISPDGKYAYVTTYISNVVDVIEL